MFDSRNWFDATPENRRRHLLNSQRQGVMIQWGDQSLINFASNDYLGLSQHPDVIAAAMNALQDGVGSGASRLVSGDDPLLHQLEAQLAEWKGFEACLVVGSGMLANLGLLQALADRHTHVFCDKLNHASLIDGTRLSGATSHRFQHLDLNQLESMLNKHPSERRIIISDGVFSMDGDVADVSTLLNLADAHDTLLVIDDAHGIGTVGECGKGLTSQANIAGHTRLIEVGTFGKSFGSYGAFILGTSELIEALRQHLRTMIYSTALPPSIVAASLTALKIISHGEIVQSLHNNLNHFRTLAKDLPLLPSNTPIQPLLLGHDTQALQAAQKLRDAGFFVPAIRPPTVPEGTSRLRITLSAAHSLDQIEALVDALRALNIGRKI